MSFSGWLADRLILQPTRHDIHVPERTSSLFLRDETELEIWVHHINSDGREKPDLYLLEFPGTASRAEHSTDFLEGCWGSLRVEIWAVNPPGYGKSSGTASLKKLSAMAEHALQELRQVAGDIPLIVAGGSLGSVSALYLAARYPVAGLLVQNPPALREVILAQSAWWSFNWATRLIAAQIPSELDSIANARRATAPAVIVSAQQDRIVPPHIQHQIIDAYKGPINILTMPDADHDTPLKAHDLKQLRSLAVWLYSAATASPEAPTVGAVPDKNEGHCRHTAPCRKA
ncbi:MAG TPA: alpha/beta hydrolase [Gammaproteobacteria bacterium]|nr:alpha/beta hydrolase [Gammaproteobacteria bacterium]